MHKLKTTLIAIISMIIALAVFFAVIKISLALASIFVIVIIAAAIYFLVKGSRRR